MNQQEVPQVTPPTLPGLVVKSLLPALLVALVVLYLFGVRGGNWMIAILAAGCCFVGIFLCALGWSYFRGMEKYYRTLPREEEGEEPPEQA